MEHKCAAENFFHGYDDSMPEPGIRVVTMPDSVKKIGARALSYMARLKTVHFSNTLESVGKYAFEFSAFERVVLPPSLRYMGEGAFRIAAGPAPSSCSRD